MNAHVSLMYKTCMGKESNAWLHVPIILSLFSQCLWGTEARLLDNEFTKADSFSTEARLLDYASYDT